MRALRSRLAAIPHRGAAAIGRRTGHAASLALVALLGTTALGAALPRIALAQDAPVRDPGREVYDKWCTPCHGSGLGKPGTMVLAQRYGTTRPALLEERTDLTPEYLETFVRQGVGVMPQFRKTEITDAELAQMIAYLLR